MFLRRSSRQMLKFIAIFLWLSLLAACSPGGEYGIDIHFVPESRFSEIEENYQPLNHGFFWAYWTPSGRIRHADILISSDIAQRFRNHFIREELTQSLGLMNDSPRFPDSIFFSGPGTNDYYLPLDQQIIAMLYQEEIKTHHSPVQVRNILQEDHSQAEVGYFFEIALNTEFGGNESAVRKWSGEIPVRIHGTPTDSDLRELEKIIFELNQLTEDIELRLTSPN